MKCTHAIASPDDSLPNKAKFLLRQRRDVIPERTPQVAMLAAGCRPLMGRRAPQLDFAAGGARALHESYEPTSS